MSLALEKIADEVYGAAPSPADRARSLESIADQVYGRPSVFRRIAQQAKQVVSTPAELQTPEEIDLPSAPPERPQMVPYTWQEPKSVPGVVPAQAVSQAYSELSTEQKLLPVAEEFGPQPRIGIGEQRRRLKGSVVAPEPQSWGEFLTKVPSAGQAYGAGFKHSIEGLGLELISQSLGKGGAITVDQDYDPGLVDKMIETAGTFLTPATLISLLPGVLPGRIGAEAVARGLVRKYGPAATVRAFQHAAPRMAETGGSFAIFDALRNTLEQAGAVERGEREGMSAAEMFGAAGRGATLGAVLGGAGAAVTNRLLRLGAEVGVLATVPPVVFEQRAPTIDDVLDAGILVGTLKLAHALPGLARRGLSKPRSERTPIEQAAVDQLPPEVKTDLLRSALEVAQRRILQAQTAEEGVPLPTTREAAEVRSGGRIVTPEPEPGLPEQGLPILWQPGAGRLYGPSGRPVPQAEIETARPEPPLLSQAEIAARRAGRPAPLLEPGEPPTLARGRGRQPKAVPPSPPSPQAEFELPPGPPPIWATRPTPRPGTALEPLPEPVAAAPARPEPALQAAPLLPAEEGPLAVTVPRGTRPRRTPSPVPETFDLADPDQLVQYVRARGGIAPSPTGALAGEYRLLPLYLKNKRGLNPEKMAEAIQEVTGQEISSIELMDRLSGIDVERGRWRAQAEVQRRQAEERGREEAEAQSLADLPVEEKARLINGMTGIPIEEAARLAGGRPSKEDLGQAIRDFFDTYPGEDPAALAQPSVFDALKGLGLAERFGTAQEVAQRYFGGDINAFSRYVLEAAGRPQEPTARFEITAQGEQGVVPGTPPREMSRTPIRPDRPQTSIEETPLFGQERAAREAEMKRAQGEMFREEERLYGYGEPTGFTYLTGSKRSAEPAGESGVGKPWPEYPRPWPTTPRPDLPRSPRTIPRLRIRKGDTYHTWLQRHPEMWFHDSVNRPRGGLPGSGFAKLVGVPWPEGSPETAREQAPAPEARGGEVPPSEKPPTVEEPSTPYGESPTLPPIPEGHIRLYRGEGIPSQRPQPEWIEQGQKAVTGRWFADNPADAGWHTPDAPKGRLVYVDLPRETAEAYRVVNLPKSHPARRSSRLPHTEFFLPPELTNQRVYLPAKGQMKLLEQGTPYRPETAEVPPPDVQAAVERVKGLLGEGGAFEPGRPLTTQALQDLVLAGRYYAGRGFRTIESWTTRMVQQFGERIRAYLDEVWQNLQGERGSFYIPERRRREPLVDAYGRPVARETREEEAPAAVAKPVPPEPPLPPPPLTEPVLALPRHREVLKAALETMQREGIKRDEERWPILSDQILDLLKTNQLRLENLRDTAQAHDLSLIDVGELLFRPSVKNAAQRLAYLSVLERSLLKLAGQANKPEARTLLEWADEIQRFRREAPDGDLKTLSWLQRADNIRRGLLVTQLATAVRNYWSQQGRLGIDVFDRSLQRVFGGEADPWVPLQALAESLSEIRPTRGGLHARRAMQLKIDGVLEAFPKEWDRLFGTYSSDIARQARERGIPLSGPDRAFSKAEKLVEILNFFNRHQEFATRRPVFWFELQSRLKRRGLDLESLARGEKKLTGEELEALEPDIRAAVEKALEMTFAQTPVYGSLGWHFVKTVNKAPIVLSGPLPFPRFMAQSLRFLYEFSPLPLLSGKIFSPMERARFRAGDRQTLARASVGTAVLLSAWLLREMQDDGNRWYEMNAPGIERPVDIRPFNPFATYFLAGEIMKRARKGTLWAMDPTDIVRGLAGVNVRAGLGLFALDKLVSGLGDLAREGKLGKAISSAGGELIAGLLVPLRTLTDLYAEFDPDLQIVRESRSAPVTGPATSQFGFGEPLHIATQEAPVTRQAPALRQLTGVTLGMPKNPAQRELDRLQFSRQEILPSTGNPEADNILAKHMGFLVETHLVPLLMSAKYQNLTDAEKMHRIRQWLSDFRSAARMKAQREDPALFKQVREERVPMREQLYRTEQRKLMEGVAP